MMSLVMNKVYYLIIFFFYRILEGKFYVLRILRIENINEKNLNFLYNCIVVSEGGIDIRIFILLKKGVRKFYFGEFVEI